MSEPAESAPSSLSRESLQRLTGLLLVVSATLLAALVALSAYLIWDKQQVAALKGSLLAQRQLQEALLAGQPSDQAPLPHLDPGISFVLNPAMQQSTFHAGDSGAYPINRIGLRGPEITDKPVGVKRIALVGDSVFFGWKIAERDKLATLLQTMVDKRLGKGRYEFVTIAIPGWNTVDQDRFLRNHLARLAPDYIVWSIIRNDLLDSAGVVPPGVLMTWNAPQKTRQQPFQFLPPAQLNDTPAPVILSRWQANLKRIADFSAEHQVPTSLLWWRAKHRPVFDYLTRQAQPGLPVIYVPGKFRYDNDNWCVDYPDCHPTRWANQRLAIALLGELVTRNAIEPVTWSEHEQTVLETFAAEALRTSSPAQQRAFFEEQSARVPAQYSADGDSPILFGVRDGKMASNGILLLRRPAGAHALHMAIGTLGSRPGPPQRVEIEVRTDQGLVAEHSAIIDESLTNVTLPLPPEADFGLYQVEWRFDHAECERPSACYSGRLLEARLEGAIAAGK